MKKLNIVFAATLLMASSFVNAQTLDELAEIVRQAATRQRCNVKKNAAMI